MRLRAREPGAILFRPATGRAQRGAVASMDPTVATPGGMTHPPSCHWTRTARSGGIHGSHRCLRPGGMTQGFRLATGRAQRGARAGHRRADHARRARACGFLALRRFGCLHGGGGPYAPARAGAWRNPLPSCHWTRAARSGGIHGSHCCYARWDDARVPSCHPLPSCHLRSAAEIGCWGGVRRLFGREGRRVQAAAMLRRSPIARNTPRSVASLGLPESLRVR